MEAQEKKTEWISVKERLPKIDPLDSISVLAICGTTTKCVLDYITDENGNGKFYLSLSFPSRVFEDFTKWVTHWMPLPSPPNDKKE